MDITFLVSKCFGRNAAQIVVSKEVSRRFIESVDPSDLLPNLVPWFLTFEESSKILAPMIQTGEKRAAANKLLEMIAAAFGNREDICLQDLVDVLRKNKKYQTLIDIIEKAKSEELPIEMAKNSYLGIFWYISQFVTYCCYYLLPNFLINFWYFLLQRNLVSKLKECYIDEFSSFKPLSFDNVTFDLGNIWINLQLENWSNLTQTKSHDCIECLNVAFQKRKVVICKGEPGTGKSTLSTYLCYKWAKEEWKDCPFDLVFPVQLRQLVGDEVKTITDAVVHAAKSYDKLVSQLNQLEQMLKSPAKCLIILDGYDEGPAVCDQLQSVLLYETKGLSFHILLTSRPWAVTDIKCPAQVVKICALTHAQRTEYVRHHFEETGKTNLGDSLIAELETNSVLKKLSETALILCYLCFYYANCEAIQANIDSLTSVYLHLIGCLIDRYQTDKLPSWKEKPFGQSWLKSEIMFNLGKMALFGLSNSRSIFTEAHIKEFNVDINICISVGLLVHNRQRIPASATVSTYIFPHLTMHEFAASLYVLRCYLEIEDESKRRVQLPVPKFPDIVLSNVLELGISGNLPIIVDTATVTILDLPTFWKMRHVFDWCCTYSELAIVNLTRKIMNPSLKSRMIGFINKTVVDRLHRCDKFDHRIFLQLCRPSTLPLFRLESHSNWCYNSVRKKLYYRHEPFHEILPQCRELPIDQLDQSVEAIFYPGLLSQLTNSLSRNFVSVNEIVNHHGFHLSLCAPQIAFSMGNKTINAEKHLHLSKLSIVYDEKLMRFITDIEVNQLYDSFTQWVHSIGGITKSRIKCIRPILRCVPYLADIDCCAKLSQHFFHLSALQIDIENLDVFITDSSDFIECWSRFENITIVRYY